MKMRNYGVKGIDERCINKWSKYLKDNLRIFSHSKFGTRNIIIIIPLTKFEAFKVRTQLFIYNRKNKTKIKLCKVKGSI